MLRAPIIAGLLIASLCCKGSTSPSDIDDDVFSPALFANPPPEFGPQTRWWWPGASVDDAGLQNKLRQFADVGYSAIEIQPFMSALTNADLGEDPRIRLDPETGQVIATENNGDTVTVTLAGARGVLLWVARVL